jgi:DNA-binding transcriptional MerR regulator
MAGSKKLYAIGEMARICNVTTKLLRYYDANHIVSPEYKDTKTNYRYYTEKQLADILFVKELKKLDFSLQDIASLLNDRELLLMQKKLHIRLDKARTELAQAREYYDQTVDTLLRVNDIIQLKGVRSVPAEEIKEVQLVEMPVYQVVSSRHPSYWNADTIFIDRRAELYKLIEDNELQTFGSVMAVFHGDYLKQFSHKPEDLVGDLEVCMQVREAKGCTQVRQAGRRAGGFHGACGALPPHAAGVSASAALGPGAWLPAGGLFYRGISVRRDHDQHPGGICDQDLPAAGGKINSEVYKLPTLRSIT